VRDQGVSSEADLLRAIAANLGRFFERGFKLLMYQDRADHRCVVPQTVAKNHRRDAVLSHNKE
jgi:hypothetical protein